jgi:hypothetical protein
MSESARRALVARGLFVGLCVVLASTACHEDETRVELFPLQVMLLQGPDTLAVGATDTLRVGANVGVVGCSLENARIERRGDSLVVRGEAGCEVRSRSYSTLALESSPEPNGQMLVFLLAGLEPGTYVTIAGDLVDTLVVVPAPHPEPERRVVAHGDIAPTSTLCTGVPVFFVDLPPPNPRFQLVDRMPPSAAQRVVLRAMRLQTPPCGDLTGVLRVRSWVPAP